MLPAVSGGFIFSTQGIRYNGVNYYEFPYEAEQKPGLRAVDNILEVIEELPDTPVILREVPNSLYQWDVIDKDSTDGRIIRHAFDAHSMITTFVRGGKAGLKAALLPDRSFSASV